MKRFWRKRNELKIIALMLILSCLSWSSMAEAEEEASHKLKDIVVTSETEDSGITYTPEKTTIDVDTYETIVVPQNVGDIIRYQQSIDFRGASDLVPGDVVDGDDTMWMRGFNSSRFVTALDGVNLHKPGGRNTFHVMDYSLLPTFLIDKIEILPGPHSALYPGQSIGGVVNLVTRAPQRYDTVKPNITISSSYKSYDTHNHSFFVRGGAGDFIYDAGYQRYATDGYLRNAEADIDSAFGRIGYFLPWEGHLMFTVSHTHANRSMPIKNDPALADYDDDYPVVETSNYSFWQHPGWDEKAISYRLNYSQPSPVGLWDMNAYYSEETWKRTTLNRRAGGLYDAGWESTWYQQGGKLQDTIQFSENHETIIGGELSQYFDSFDTIQGARNAFDDEKRLEILAGFLQHKWRIMPRLTATGGLRYEHASVWINNVSSSTGGPFITGQPDWIERDWGDWLPKLFLTYELDDHAEFLRDTSVSLGVSRIWRAPIFFGDFNPRGMPAGAWLEPEHGIGYDVVFSRRLFNDIELKVDFAHYEIKDYIAWNWDFAQYTPSATNPVPPGMEYSDYCINLDKVIRQGVEVQLSGHIIDDLSFYFGYAYQTFENKGGEPTGETVLDDMAEHRINAGLRYNLFKNTQLLLDYRYQDEQVAQKLEEIAPDEWVFTAIPMDAYHVFDFAVQQTLFKDYGPLQNGSLKFYISNLFDEDYQELSGYPATDRTFGIALSVDL